MPLYEYNCKACGHDFEEQRPFAKADEAKCPECGSEQVIRLASAIASKCQGQPAFRGGPPVCRGGG